MTLRILITGGTFDKRYDAIRGQLTFADTHLPDIVSQVRCSLPIELEINQLVDSLDMQDDNRQRVLEACRRAPEPFIIITHGTDTMRETAAVLGKAKLGKTIVLTGAMIPYEIANSDAMFNFGFACAAAQTLSQGVYVAMNGHVFGWDSVRKNQVAGLFESA